MTSRTGLGRTPARRPRRPLIRATLGSPDVDATGSVDERVAYRGWGPTLRIALLRCSQGIANRLAGPRTDCPGHTRLRTTAGLTGAALAVYARTRGWL